MTTTETPAPPRPKRRPGDFEILFPELYRSAFTAAHAELGSRADAHEVTHATLARAHARWSRIGDSPAFWVSTAARTHALDVLQRQPPGREVLMDDEAELSPGDVPDPGAGDLATVTRRGSRLRMRRRAGWAAAVACVLASVALVSGLTEALPPSVLDATSLSAVGGGPDQAVRVVPAPADRRPIAPVPWQDEDRTGLAFGRISAGRSEQGSVRVTFLAGDYTRDGEVLVPARTGLSGQLVIDPDAPLVLHGPTVVTPEELVRVLNRSTPGGQAEVWVRSGQDGKITALRQE
ncbi:hypothetical protein KIH74_27190 [Kineosporia sp. J2-2]|uniref:Uncharacterized protein n=1 Tax=Kineosporia corallincola TaxID=2835133 RepID=A0ABS5TR49_9ACTN|nr:hypothetical protein [Kineosporia corallincola]MBT0772659.1 hypothetical protein [Kineosporia corallincola]